MESEIVPYCQEWDEAKELPEDLLRKCFDAQILPASCGGKWPTKYIGPGPSDFDAFHELIMIDELSRCGSGGVCWGIFGGLAIGLPPVLLFGSDYLKDRVAADCLRGDKRICLCITEPTAGSDVANLKCSAVKSADGSHYIVNGEKKWITNGVTADYFTVACRTGGPGHAGISMLLIERSMPGVKTRQMDCTGVWASGTTYITFDDVKVPAKNLIGKEGHGFRYIMYNFNHERWMLIAQAVRFARVCLEESVKHAMRRKTFGKKLMEHPVIRFKIAEMARQVEATQAMLESLTYQMMTMTKEEQNLKLGGDTAMLKVQATKVSLIPPQGPSPCHTTPLPSLPSSPEPSVFLDNPLTTESPRFSDGPGLRVLCEGEPADSGRHFLRQGRPRREGGEARKRGQGVRHPRRIRGNHARLECQASRQALKGSQEQNVSNRGRRQRDRGGRWNLSWTETRN